MRTLLVSLLVLTAAATTARAEDSVAGVYDIKIDEMADNCSPAPVVLSNKTIRLDVKGTSLTVNLETIPQMAGTTAKNGRISAKTAKIVPTTVAGLDGTYTIAGHVAPDRSLELVLVAEYSRNATKKAYCTQSWTLTGKKQSSDVPAPPPAKPVK